MKSSQQAKLAEKTDYRISIEYLANLATKLESGEKVDLPAMEVAKHIRKVLHGARG
jgi:hypothetical protein